MKLLKRFQRVFDSGWGIFLIFAIIFFSSAIVELTIMAIGCMLDVMGYSC